MKLSIKTRGRIAIAAGLLVASLAAHADEGLRPELGKPLQAAQQLIKSQRYKDALGKVREADSIGAKSATETLYIERMRLAAASGAADIESATKAFEKLDASPSVTQAEKLRAIESIAGTAFRARDYSRAKQWANRYFKDGGNSASVRLILTQSEYQSGDFAGVLRDVLADIQSTEKTRGVPSEDSIKLLLGAATKLNDDKTYVYGVEKLLTYHPKKQYWSELLSRLQARPQFSGRFALDTYRLALATGSLTRAEDFIEYAQAAAQAGYPIEGKQVVEKGYAAGVLGTGADAARHQRLRDLLSKRSDEDRANWAQAESQARSANDGNALVKLGYNIVVAGNVNKGVSLIQEGIPKTAQEHADAGKLRLGIAQALSGENAKAAATFRSVSGSDGAAELARLWVLYTKGKSGSA